MRTNMTTFNEALETPDVTESEEILAVPVEVEEPGEEENEEMEAEEESEETESADDQEA